MHANARHALMRTRHLPTGRPRVHVAPSTNLHKFDTTRAHAEPGDAAGAASPRHVTRASSLKHYRATLRYAVARAEEGAGTSALLCAFVLLHLLIYE